MLSPVIVPDTHNQIKTSVPTEELKYCLNLFLHLSTV